MVVDPLHDSYSDKTPYNFVRNNPLRLIDLWGADSTKYAFDLYYDVHKHPDNYYVRNNGSSGGSSSPINTSHNGNDRNNNANWSGVNSVLGLGLTLVGVYPQFSQWNYVYEGMYYNAHFAEWYLFDFRGNNFFSALSRYEALTNARAWGIGSRGVFAVGAILGAVEVVYELKKWG